MSALEGCQTFGQAGHNRSLADIQDTRADERLSGMDTLRHQVCQKFILEDGPMDMLANRQKDGKEFP